MVTHGIVALATTAPPDLFVPGLGDAFLGWLMGLIVLVGPFALVATSWQRRHGRWWYVFTQWNTTAFWLLTFGSIAAAAGMFSLLGMIPAWQTAWDDWYLLAYPGSQAVDATVYSWLQMTQREYAVALQVTASIIFLLGAAAVAVGQSRLARKMAFFQRQGTEDWLVAPAEAPATTAAARRPTHPLNG
jgi:hypothetical protein